MEFFGEHQVRYVAHIVQSDENGHMVQARRVDGRMFLNADSWGKMTFHYPHKKLQPEKLSIAFANAVK